MTPRRYVWIIIVISIVVALAVEESGVDPDDVYLVFLLIVLGIASMGSLYAYLYDRAFWPFTLAFIWLVVAGVIAERANAFGFNGWITLGGLLLLPFGVILVVGPGWATRNLAKARETAVEQHRIKIVDRRRVACDAGMDYEETSAEVAKEFGRLEQQIPDDFVKVETRLVTKAGKRREERRQLERERIVLEHAASLEATSVVRTRTKGFPVTVFDLEMLHHDVLLERSRAGLRNEFAIADATYWLTVWMVGLPMALPFVSSAVAIELNRTLHDVSVDKRPEDWVCQFREGDSTWANDHYRMWSEDPAQKTDARGGTIAAFDDEARRRRMSLMTDNAQLATTLLRVPLVWQWALDTRVPAFFIDGDHLIASALSKHGIESVDVLRGIELFTRVVQALPWPQLERYRVDSSKERHQRFFRIYRETVFEQDQLTLERWREGTTRSGLRQHARTHVLSWRRLRQPDHQASNP